MVGHPFFMGGSGVGYLPHRDKTTMNGAQLHMSHRDSSGVMTGPPALSGLIQPQAPGTPARRATCLVSRDSVLTSQQLRRVDNAYIICQPDR
jgi:hypothetical protein